MVRFDSKVDINTALKIGVLIVAGIFALFKLTTTVRATADTLADIRQLNATEHNRFDQRIGILEATALRLEGYNSALAAIKKANEDDGTN